MTNSNKGNSQAKSTELLMLQSLMEQGSSKERAEKIIESMTSLDMEKYLGLIKESP